MVTINWLTWWDFIDSSLYTIQYFMFMGGDGESRWFWTQNIERGAHTGCGWTCSEEFVPMVISLWVLFSITHFAKIKIKRSRGKESDDTKCSYKRALAHGDEKLPRSTRGHGSLTHFNNMWHNREALNNSTQPVQYKLDFRRIIDAS